MAKNSDKKAGSRIGAGLKEAVRKLLVAIKKNPQALPLVALTISFCLFSFDLTSISDTTAKVYGKNMGLCAFISMLCSILSYVCMFSAFPKRKKPNYLMVVLMLAMYGIIIFVDAYYIGRINYAISRPENPIQITQATFYILKARYTMQVHIITTIITMVCVVLEPVFAKLLKKINTSIDVEDNGDIGSIDISDEE